MRFDFDFYRERGEAWCGAGDCWRDALVKRSYVTGSGILVCLAGSVLKGGVTSVGGMTLVDGLELVHDKHV